MKLSGHYNKASIIISISVLFMGAGIYFLAINYISRNQLDLALTEEIDELQSYVNIHNQLPTEPDYDEYETIILKSDKNISGRRYFDTTYNDVKDNRTEKARAVESGVSIPGKFYKVIITVSKEGTEYLLQMITLITLVLIVGLLVTLFLTNRYVLKNLWKPFYNLLNQLKSFTVTENKNFVLMKNNVDEFAELNTAMNVMSSRIKNDFQNLKHFTENASHEILTPLSVITSKLDILIQDETLSRSQYAQITDIYVATSKLARLNQSLLLLAKIENNLMGSSESVSVDAMIFEKLRQFHELIQAKQLIVAEMLDLKWICCSKYLFEILLNNLFSNAIRHNVTNGKIKINLTDQQLVFQNSGASEPLNSVKIFDRFQKSEHSEGAGLGLTIVKNICTLYKWEISYSFLDSLHTFQITF